MGIGRRRRTSRRRRDERASAASGDPHRRDEHRTAPRPDADRARNLYGNLSPGLRRRCAEDRPLRINARERRTRHLQSLRDRPRRPSRRSADADHARRRQPAPARGGRELLPSPDAGTRAPPPKPDRLRVDRRAPGRRRDAPDTVPLRRVLDPARSLNPRGRSARHGRRHDQGTVSVAPGDGQPATSRWWRA